VVTTDDRLIPSLRRNLKFITTKWNIANAENTANIRGLTTECQRKSANDSSRQPLES